MESAGDAGHEFLVFTDIDVAMQTSLLLNCLAAQSTLSIQSIIITN